MNNNNLNCIIMKIIQKIKLNVKQFFILINNIFIVRKKRTIKTMKKMY